MCFSPATFWRVLRCQTVPALEQHLRAVGLIQSEIWRIAAISSWPGVVERDGLVLDLQLTIFYLLGQLFFKAAKPALDRRYAKL